MFNYKIAVMQDGEVKINRFFFSEIIKVCFHLFAAVLAHNYKRQVLVGGDGGGDNQTNKTCMSDCPTVTIKRLLILKVLFIPSI